MYFIWVAFLCTFFASAISLVQIRTHLIDSRHPRLRIYTVRIVAMVPIYACESFLGMIFYRQSAGINVLRSCYESVVLYSFYQFLIVALGGQRNLADMLAYKPPVRHQFPVQWMRPWTMGNTFLKLTTVGILQYVPIKVVCSLAGAGCYLLGDFNQGQFKTNDAYLWITIVVNFSQMWALYCLFLFYLGTRDELAPIKPVAKFAAVKLIVFATWWQQLGFAMAVDSGLLTAEMFGGCEGDDVAHLKGNTLRCWTADDVGEMLQDCLVCVEMLVFAIAHHYIFTVPTPLEYDQTRGEDWEHTTSADQEKRTYQNLRSAIALTDLVHDAKASQQPLEAESYHNYMGRVIDGHRHTSGFTNFHG
jgi:hypothetical protein